MHPSKCQYLPRPPGEIKFDISDVEAKNLDSSSHCFFFIISPFCKGDNLDNNIIQSYDESGDFKSAQRHLSLSRSLCVFFHCCVLDFENTKARWQLSV